MPMLSVKVSLALLFHAGLFAALVGCLYFPLPHLPLEDASPIKGESTLYLLHPFWFDLSLRGLQNTVILLVVL